MEYETIKTRAIELGGKIKGLVSLTLKELSNRPDDFLLIETDESGKPLIPKGYSNVEKIFDANKGILPVYIAQNERDAPLPRRARQELTKYASRDPRINAAYISNPAETNAVLWVYPCRLD